MTQQQAGVGLKIFHKILITMLAVALIPLAGLFYISSYQVEQDWRKNVESNLAMTADRLLSEVNTWVNMNVRVLQEHSTLADMASMEPAKQQPLLKAIQNTYPWAYLVFTANLQGQNIGRSDAEQPQAYQYGDRDYFKQVLAGKDLGQEVVIGKTSQKPALILASSIRTGDNIMRGVIALAMQLVDVSATIAATKVGTTGFAILVDANNKVIAHGRPERIAQQLQDFSEHPAIRTKPAVGQPIFFEEQGQRIVASVGKTQLGWTLIVQQSYDDAFAPLLAAKRNTWIITLIVLTLVLLLASLLSRQLAQPISQLTAIAENISRGNFEAKMVGTERRDEIGALARAIERMGASIKIAFDRLRKKA